MAQSTQTREVRMLKSPLIWPRYPALPVVKLHASIRQPEYCGIVHSSNTKRVYFSSEGMGVNIFGLPSSDELRRKLGRQPTWNDVLSILQHVDYASEEELLLEWRID